MWTTAQGSLENIAGRKETLAIKSKLEVMANKMIFYNCYKGDKFNMNTQALLLKQIKVGLCNNQLLVWID